MSTLGVYLEKKKKKKKGCDRATDRHVTGAVVSEPSLLQLLRGCKRI